MIEMIMNDDCSKCRSLNNLLNDEGLTAEKLVSNGAALLAEWDGDDKGRSITIDDDAYVLVLKDLCPHMRYHSIIFRRNGKNKNYSPEISLHNL